MLFISVIYVEVWNPHTGETFVCFKEDEKVYERIAVAVTSMERFVLGHLQHELSNLLLIRCCAGLLCVSLAGLNLCINTGHINNSSENNALKLQQRSLLSFHHLQVHVK